MRAPGWLRGGGPDQRGALVEELEAEVALLREENARLKIRGARAGARPWDGRMGEAAPRRAEAGTDDDVWELLTECQVLRTALVDACRDVDAAMQQIGRRLDAMTTPEGDVPGTAETGERAAT